MAQAGCQKPLRREPARGPQHHVKPAASTDLQPESRAGHVTAKATSAAPQSGGARAAGLGGVWGAARVHGEERNTRGPSARPGSGQRDSYKPTAKASACAAGVRGDRSSDEPRDEQREGSEGSLRWSRWPSKHARGHDRQVRFQLTPVGPRPSTKCANCNADSGSRPSDPRSAASMP